jgi:hypothetical protein
MQTADGGGESPPDKKDVFVHSPTPALLVMNIMPPNISYVCGYQST